MTELTIENLKSDVPLTNFHTIVTLHNHTEIAFRDFAIHYKDSKDNYQHQELSLNEVKQLEMLCLSIWSHRGTKLAKKLYLILCVQIDEYFDTQLQQEVLASLK